MNFLRELFKLHTHTFDPNKWELIYELRVSDEFGFEYTKYTYSNTCLTCGDIIFRTKKVK